MLARSPAMREGFKPEDWVVKRTPVNTPGAPDEDGNKLIVGMINLSDDDEEEEGVVEEDETRSVENILGTVNAIQIRNGYFVGTVK